MPIDKNEQNSRSTSEYASITPRTLINDDCGHDQQITMMQAYIRPDKDVIIDSKMDTAILKITEKYDSLGSLRASLERLDIVNELDDQDEKVPLEYEQQHQKPVTRPRHFYNRHNSVDVSDQDLHQVEAFFKSHKTLVNVCPTLANLYFSTPGSTSGNTTLDPDWQLAYTGIPVLLLDSGETRSRTKRRIQIVLSEKGTGFLLWKDTIDNLSNYRASDAHFHTMYLSADHRRMVGLSFDNASAARDFFERIETLTSDPANISLSGPLSSKQAKKAAAKQKRKREKALKVKLPHKTDISQPCCFQHVTKVELDDKEQFVTLATLTGTSRGNTPTDQVAEEKQPEITLNNKSINQDKRDLKQA